MLARGGQPAVGGALPLHRILLALFWCLSALPAATAYTNCSAFSTNGTAASQFSYYRFYDFRNIPSDTWDSVQNATSPNNETAGASTSDMSWSLDWQRRDGLRYAENDPNNPLLPIDYQLSKVAMTNVTDDSDATTALSFLSSRENEASQQSSGIDFNEDSILYLSLRLKARVTGDPGACAAFFTYENDTQEADMELLTRDDQDIVGFNTQPSIDVHGNYINATHFNMSLPNDLTREKWITYRMDWVSDQVVWYVDGVQMANTYTNVPVEPSHLYLTMWGNGGTWTRMMTLGDSALLEIQWIEVTYNLSDATPIANASGTVCNLDDTDTAGSFQPFIFPAPHDDTSSGYKLGINAFLTISAIILALI
ncbi:concanavalin A-like lectin/glucanase domain-containing protein [Truncatella angustata]|uniref:Concanavalin A-like lectin/glucanase domain-containing protein n=1 Tax=Truncatella angustata TaxID=152316 RepID=A0A9P8UYP4_9PEZI|nr:concanavalin A-like lectin/glucanase domain-containing protein [Truncatella angustata]KAH6660637.1 concanavalin A-like lectin/glucanase domain-containing protein [Truncatella angustata]KAH8199126.1 hypothetical protein TruAng_006712 [Truncatella angustata]